MERRFFSDESWSHFVSKLLAIFSKKEHTHDQYATDAEVKTIVEAYDYATTDYAENKAADAQGAAETKAAELDASLKAELQSEIDSDVKAFADTVYTKTAVNALLTWNEF